MTLRFWTAVLTLATRVGWTRLANTASAARFRALLARQKLDAEKIRAHSGASDDTEASAEQGITPTSVKRPRRAKPPKRSASHG